MGNITSAYDGDPITVDSMLKDPTWIPTRVINSLDGAFLENLLFRNGGSNESGVVAFREAAKPYLNDDAERVAEFGEIPVSDLSNGKVRSVIGEKVALAIRVSYEMRHENKVDLVGQQVTALQNTMIRSGVRASIAAFEASSAPTAPATDEWNVSGGDPVKDIFDAVEQIQSAQPTGGGDDDYFGYNPDTILAHPTAVTALVRNEKVQKFYIGSVAGENPLYRGVLPQTVCGLQIVQSRFLDPSKVIVLESGVVGFYSDTYPLQMTPVYSEGGESGSGGPNMSWRADAFRKRILAVDNPKAAVTITGVL